MTFVKELFYINKINPFSILPLQYDETVPQYAFLNPYAYYLLYEWQQESHHLYFRVNNYIAERINKFYRVPDADTPPEFCKFVTASDVMERICTNPAFRQSMSNKDISMFMEALGFKKIHRKTGNGWKVIEMRPDEIENNQKMDGSENIPPGDLPF